jgi:hypothetical protein
MPNSVIANSIMGRKIDFPEFFRKGTGCYCLFCEDNIKIYFKKIFVSFLLLSSIYEGRHF